MEAATAASVSAAGAKFARSSAGARSRSHVRLAVAVTPCRERALGGINGGSVFDDDRYSAITNGVFFKHPLFNKTFYFDDLQFTWQQLQHKLDDLPVAFNDIKKQIKRIMLLSYKSAKPKLKHRIGSFQLLAADFAVDATGKVWLHEFNVSPGFKPGPDTYTSPLAQRLKKMSNDAVRLSIGAQRRQIDGKNLYDSSWMNECTNNTEWEELFIERA